MEDKRQNLVLATVFSYGRALEAVEHRGSLSPAKTVTIWRPLLALALDPPHQSAVWRAYVNLKLTLPSLRGGMCGKHNCVN